MKWLLQIFLAKYREFLPESRRKSNVGYRYKGKEEINMKYLQGIVGSMVSTMAVDPEKAILATILTVVGGGLIFIVRNRESVKGLFSYGRE